MIDEPHQMHSFFSCPIQLSPESVADLVDLEQELSSIQRGITQMERITPNDPPNKNSAEGDPFGDSFTQMQVKLKSILTLARFC